MSGKSCASWVGVASVLFGEPRRETKPSSADGSRWNGPGLKKAEKLGAYIGFLDESGFTERPPVRRSWAPKGKTPVLTETLNWKNLSAIATLIATPTGRKVRLTLRLVPGTVKSRQIRTYLSALRLYLKGKRLVLLWDRLTVHRSRAVQRYVARQKAWLVTEFLPPYAPELNPVEYLWSYVSNTDMANFCADYLGQIRRQVHKAAGRVRHRQDLGRAFLRHSGLF